MSSEMPLLTGTQLDIAADVRGNEMSKYLASLVFAGCALTATPAVAAPAANDTPTVATDSTTVAVQQVRMPVPGLRDEAAMVLVGTALIGLGAAVRRSA
jgi:hypothetical protein